MECVETVTMKLPKTYQDFIEILKTKNIEVDKSFIYFNFNGRNFAIFSEKSFDIISKEVKEEELELKIKSRSQINFPSIRKTIQKKEFTNYRDKLELIDEAIEKFKKAVLKRNKEDHEEFEKNKKEHIEFLRKNLYDKEEFDKFKNAEVFENIKDKIKYIPEKDSVIEEYFTGDNRKCQFCHDTEKRFMYFCSDCKGAVIKKEKKEEIREDFFICTDCLNRLEGIKHVHPLLLKKN